MSATTRLRRDAGEQQADQSRRHEREQHQRAQAANARLCAGKRDLRRMIAPGGAPFGKRQQSGVLLLGCRRGALDRLRLGGEAPASITRKLATTTGGAV